MSKGTEAAGQLTATEYNKEDVKSLRAALRAKKKKKPGGCENCDDCGDCRADIAIAQIRRANSMIIKVEQRVQAMLEKALVT